MNKTSSSILRVLVVVVVAVFLAGCSSSSPETVNWVPESWSQSGLLLSADTSKECGPSPSPCSTIYNYQDGDITRLTDKTGAHRARWSPDGQMALFVVNKGNDKTIWTTKDGVETEIAKGYWGATWSPDNTKIAAIKSVAGGAIEVRTITLVGIPAEQTLFQLEGDADVSWSPDGKSFLFTSLSAGELYVTVHSLENSQTMRLAVGSQAVWSPDGRQIAFVRENGPLSDLYIILADGSDQQELVKMDDHYLFAPVWSPDGDKIAFAVREPSKMSPAEVQVVTLSSLKIETLDLK